MTAYGLASGPRAKSVIQELETVGKTFSKSKKAPKPVFVHGASMLNPSAALGGVTPELP